MGSDFTARPYEKKDEGFVSRWWSLHTAERSFLPSMLPPVGIVVEQNGVPVSACWVHLSAGVGVAFLDSPVSRPGLSVKDTAADAKQDKPANGAEALKFFNWAYANGEKTAADLDYVPMPASVVALIQKSWGEVKDGAGKAIAYK